MVDETILSPEDHDHFLTHGYVVVQNVVPPAVIERAVAELEAEDPDPEFDPAASCTTDIVFQVLTELFGPEYPFAKKRGGSDMARPRKDDVEWALPPAHVDDAYPTLMPNNWAVGTFIFLTRVHSRGGAFIYFSGSPLRYRQGMARSYHSIKEVAAAAHFSGPAEEFLADPGDVLFFHHLMGHTGSDNVADQQTRHALLARWVLLDKRIEDLIIAAYYSDSNCAFVADVIFDGCESSLPYYIQPRDVAVAEGELQPLAYEGSEAPRRVRIFNRGPSFWLVVFARGAEDSLFWGAIDWEQSPPTLRTLSDAAALDEAQRIIGMI